MKETYTEESWERFKELNQKATKRLSIAETRAQNNEDDISELKPKVTKLEEFVDNVNDMTTGVNLIRGSRDIRVGTIPYGTADSLKLDGFSTAPSIHYEVYKDESGYAVYRYLGTSPSATYRFTNVLLPEQVNGHSLTISFEYMVESETASNGQLAQLVKMNLNGGTSPTLKSYYYDDSNLKRPLTRGQWYKVILYYDEILNLSDNEYLRLGITSGPSADLTRIVNFRKVKVEIGHINDPIYSVSPLDMVLEPVNDITTGINLLRGTRDFLEGVSKYSSGSYVTDGFYLTANQKAIATFDKDENGFGVLKLNATASTTGNVASSVWDENPKIGDTYTAIFDVYVDSIGGSTNKQIAVFRTVYCDSSASVQGGVSFSIGSGLELKKWQTVVLYLTVTSEGTGKAFCPNLVFQLNGGEGSVYFRKAGIYKGTIEHPEWSASPFDVASSQVEKCAPKTLGTVLPSNVLRNINLDDVVIPGRYNTDGTNPGNVGITNYPANESATMDVISLVGAKGANGGYSYLAQIYTSVNLKVFQRTKMGASASWGPWIQIAGENSVTTIAGGGTGGDTLEKARENLKIAGFLEENPLASISNDTFDFWNNKPSGLYLFSNGKTVMAGQPSPYGVLFHWTRVKNIFTQIYFLEGTGNLNSFWLRKVNAENAGKPLPEFIGLPTQLYQPYASGIYPGRNLKDVFRYLTDTNTLPNVLASRVSQGNFIGINIGDFVDIVCTGNVTRRYVVAAIDPYYRCGSPSRMGHHLVMVPETYWALNTARDGEYAVGTNSVYIRWNTTSTNNGTSTEQNPYLASNLHKWETEVCLKQFPQEWQDVMIDYIARVEIRHSDSASLTESVGSKWANLGKIWSPSTIEYYGSQNKASTHASLESVNFPYYSLCNISATSVPSVWFRDAMEGSDTAVLTSFYLGGISSASANGTSIGALPCFLLG